MSIYENKYFIWGTGMKMQSVLSYCKREIAQIDILGYIDNDIAKQGEKFHGKMIYPPSVLDEIKDAYIIIVNISRKYIMEQIASEYPHYIDRVADFHFFDGLQLLNRYAKSEDEEIQDCMKYIKQNGVQVFNYTFTEKYNADHIMIEYDEACNLFYTYYSGKKMYISRDFDTESKAKKYINSILLEQDIQSPHRYIIGKNMFLPDDIVVDAGVAEGFFSLDIVDVVKKIYLIEPDINWLEALKHTFADYLDKVVFVNKALSDYIDEDTTTLDEVLNGNSINILKMDIEGAEVEALNGAEKSISISNRLKCFVCTYHQEYAYDCIVDYFKKHGLRCEHSLGYMYYPDTLSMKRPKLRRGLVRAFKGGV